MTFIYKEINIFSMWRRLLKELTEWADNPDRMVLLIEGVRQCGKTYILKELGRTRFSGNMLYVDFEKDREVHSIPTSMSIASSTNLASIITKISLPEER